jgi:hypothetical protein
VINVMHVQSIQKNVLNVLQITTKLMGLIIVLQSQMQRNITWIHLQIL